MRRALLVIAFSLELICASSALALLTPTKTVTPGGPTMTPTPTIPTGPQLLCRGGDLQGEICWTDSDCPGTPPPTPGINECSRYGGPRRCRWERRCNVSTSTVCGASQECPLYPASRNMQALGGLGVNTNDWCNFDNHQMIGDECQTDADCKICTAGTTTAWNGMTNVPVSTIGYQCNNNGDCGTGGACGGAGSGKCLNGMAMDECGYGNTVGNPHDIWSDQAVAARSGQDTEILSMDAKRIRHVASLGINKSNGDVWTKDVVRLTKRSPSFSTNMAATETLGQLQYVHQLDEGLPGDMTHCAIGLHVPPIDPWSLWGDVLVYSGPNSGTGFDFGNVQGVWDVARYAIKRFAINATRGDAPLFVLGWKDIAQTSKAWFEISDNPGQIALQPRCQGGSNQGGQCTVDTDCPSSSCKVDLLFCDSGDSSHCAIWKDIGHARNGAPPQISLGFESVGYCAWGTNIGNACYLKCASGADAGKVCVDSSDCAGGAACNATTDCNDGGCFVSNFCNAWDGVNVEAYSARTLCYPFGAIFDLTGRPIVSDGARWHSNRLLRYPKNVASGGNADRVWGHSLFTEFAGGCDSTHLQGPHGLDIDSTGRICAADTGCNRAVCINSPSTSGQAFDIPIGQPNLASAAPGLSSDNASCDRLRTPQMVKFDAADNLWLADTGNGRQCRVDAPLTAGKACNINTLQGVPDCTTSHPLANAKTVDPYGAGVVDTLPGLAVVDSDASRINWWDTVDHARQIDTNGEVRSANAILGQIDDTKFYPNKGSSAGTVPTPSSSSLRGPRISTYTSQGLKPGLWIPDALNNRLARAAKPFLTNMSWSDIIGQANANGFAPGLGASSLSFPVCAKADMFGNIWVCDYNNQRVVVVCNQANTIEKVGGGFICSAANSGDGTFDMVLGKATFTEGFDTTPCSSASPAQNKLCAPSDVIPDLARNRVIIADQRIGSFGGDNQSGRTLEFKGPFESGMNADSCFGCPAALPVLPAKTRGFCTNAAGASAGVECSYTEPAGAAAGTGSKTCTAPASKFGNACASNATCDSTGGAGDGFCGCPGTHPYCLWDRSIGMPGTLALHPTRDSLFVTRVAWPLDRGVLEFRDTGSNYAFQPAARVYGQEAEAAFERTKTASVGSDGLWVVFSGNGISFDSGGDLYVPADDGSQYQTVIHVLEDPLPPNTATPTASNTPTPSNTVPPGSTATNTPSPTPTPTATRTFTMTFTPTITATVTRTPTAGPPTSTANPLTPSTTPTVTITPVPGQPGGKVALNPHGSVAEVAPSDTLGSAFSFSEACIGDACATADRSIWQAPGVLAGPSTHFLTGKGNLPLNGIEAPGVTQRCVRIDDSGMLVPAESDCLGDFPIVEGASCADVFPTAEDGAKCIERHNATDTVSTMPSLWIRSGGAWLKAGALQQPEWAWAGTCNGSTATPRDFSVPSSGAPTLSCITTGTNLPTKAVLGFPSGSTTCAFAEFSGNWAVPGYAGYLTLVTQYSAALGSATWQISTVCRGDFDIDDASWTNTSSFLTTVPSPAGTLQVLPFAYGPPCPPSAFTRVKVCRIGGSVATAYLLGVRKDVVVP